MPNLKNKTKFTGSSIPKNSGWLEKYGDGGETDPPFLEIKKPIIAEAESTGVAKPNITNINLNEKHLGRDRESLNYMHALQLLKKHDVTVDSTGNILEDIGLPSSAYYNPITRTINYKPTEENKRDYKFSLKKEYTDMIMKELPHAIQSDSLGTLKFLKNTIKEGISDVITNKLEKTGLNRYDENDKIEGHAHNVLEQKLIKERNKALGYDKFNYNLMSSTLKLKKVSKYVNTKKEMGGWLDTYAGGGETDPPVNLRSASTQLASPVSTQAPEVPLNKTGWDWVKQKYENRQPSEWNMLMMDKSGSYVDSGIDPFSLMLTAPQQVIKAGVKGGKALLDASKSNKIKQVIHEDVKLVSNAKRSQELDGEAFSIYKGNKNVGEISGKRLSNGDFEVSDIGVDSQFQKQGIGTQVYKQLNQSLEPGNKVKSWGAFVENNGVAPGKSTWQSLEKQGLAKLNEKGTYEMLPKELPGSSNASSIGKEVLERREFLQNSIDLQEAKKFAQQYGYELPKNLERISQSNELTNRTIRGMMDRHNTFVRGVSTNWDEIAKKNPEILRHLENKGIDWQNNPKAAAEYMSTHIPINTGYGRVSLNNEVFDRGLEGLYTSNSFPTAEGYTYGKGFVVKAKKPTDFSSPNRKDWITKNNPHYRDEDKFRELAFPLSDEANYAITSSKSKSWRPKIEDEKLLKNATSKQKAIKQIEYRIEELKKNISEIEPNKDKFIDSHKVLSSKKETIKQLENDVKYLHQHGDEILKVPGEFNLLRTEREAELDIKNGFKFNEKLKEFLKSKGKDIHSSNPASEEGEILYQQILSQEAKYRNAVEDGLTNKVQSEFIYDFLIKKYPEFSDFSNSNKYAHYIHLGTPGKKVLEPIKSWEITPEIWKNKSRAHTNKYSKKFSALKYGGWLEQYGDGGETDPPVNLRSASTPLTSAVSTEAPKVKLNKTGFDWAWENANKVTTKEGPTIQMMYNEGIDNKESSNSNFFLPDKYGKYVDSGVSPFDLMFGTSKAVPSALAKITNKIEKAGTAAAPYIKKALSTQLPGMANVSGATVGNAINSYFIGHGAAHITPDAIEMYKNPSWSNAGSIAMDILEMYPLIRPLIGPTSKFIGNAVNASKESGILSNASKLNPKAFKENPLDYYRGIGKEGLKKAQETNLIGSKNPQVYTSPYFAKQGDFKIAKHFNPDVIVEAKGKSLYDDLSNLNKDDLVFTRSNMGSVPLKHSSLSKVTPGVNLEGDLADVGLEGISLNNPNIRILKKDWWQGYKPIEFNKNTPSFSNVNKVDDFAINLESQIANLKQQEVLAEKSRKVLFADYKAGNITAAEYTAGAKKLNPGLEGTNPRFELEKQLREYKVKQDIINVPQQNILKSEEQLGKNISDGGTNNKGVFELGDDYVARLSAHGYDDASRLVNYADKIKSPRIAKTLQVKELNGKVYQVQNKVTGTPIPKLSETELQNIPKKHIDNFWKDKAELDNLGLSIDISGGKSNIFYDPKKGFQFIDLGIGESSTNEVIAQTYKGLKLPGSPNAVSSSEDVVQQLRNELSEKGIISQQKTLNLPWKEPIRKGVEPWGYGNDNASLLPITGSKFKDVKGAIVGGKNPSYLSDKEYLMKSGNYDAKLRKANDLLIKEGKDPVYDDDMKELLKNKPVLSNEKNIKDAINLRDKIKYTYEESKYRISPDNTYLNESFTKNQRNRYATWDMYLGKPQKEHSMYDISELTKSKKDVIYTIKEDFMNKHAIQRKFDSFFKDIDNEKFAGSKIESSWKQKDNSFIIPDTDNNMFGTMGGFHWKLEKMADGNFKAIANDVWDLQPFKNSKLPKVIRNLEVGKTLGIGKPLNVKVGFILDGKTKKIIKTFGLGGTVLQTAASQNKQDNSQWLNKYK